MSEWRDEIDGALRAFVTVADCAGEPIRRSELKVEYCAAPHKQPPSLPTGKMAIYAFWCNGEWLKIGKAGPNSGPRYVGQHYTGNAMSTLAGSLTNDPKMLELEDFDPGNPGKWIKQSTCRVNILMTSSRRRELLSLLEAFLHVRLKPRYEG